VAIAVASASSATANGADVTVTKPSGTVDGDLLVAVGWSDPDGPALSAPAGWTLAGSAYSGPAGSGGVWTRVAASEGASWTWPGSTLTANHVHVLRVTGHGGSLDVAPVWVAIPASGTSHGAPSVTPTGTDSLLVCGWWGIFASATVTWTPPSGMTEATDARDSAGWASSSVAWVALAASGATGTKSATSTVASNGSYGSVGLALAVATAGGGSTGAAASGEAAPGLVVRASHVGGVAAPGLIVRAGDVTSEGETTPLVGGWVLASDLAPAPVAPDPGGDTGGGGGDPGGGGAVIFGAAGPECANGTLAAQLASKTVGCASTWADGYDAAINQWEISSGGSFASWSKPIDIAVGGMWTSKGHSWSSAASGGLDSTWTTVLNKIKSSWGSRPYSYLHLRFCHELNNGYEWRLYSANVSNYITAFRRFAALQRSILPGSFVLWPLNDDSNNGFLFTDAYPGDAYVDIISIDSYNQYPWVNTLSAWTSRINTVDGTDGPHGIETWRQFALAHGKPMCISEWSNCGDTAGGGGGGESPNYVQWFHDWCVTNGGTGPGQVKYANLFNLWTQFQMWPTTMQPNTWARYKAIF
jgi:hypothetical protein